MAILSDIDRKKIWAGLMRYWSGLRESVGVSKAELLEAVNAADAWVDNNSAAYNSALPAAFRTNATPSQKSLLLVGVVLMRFNLDLLKRVFGEVD